jgi:hypothetical protein
MGNSFRVCRNACRPSRQRMENRRNIRVVQKCSGTDPNSFILLVGLRECRRLGYRIFKAASPYPVNKVIILLLIGRMCIKFFGTGLISSVCTGQFKASTRQPQRRAAVGIGCIEPSLASN